MSRRSTMEAFGSFCEEESFFSRENCENQQHHSSYLDNLAILRKKEPAICQDI